MHLSTVMTRQITHVIWDLDGLLLDTERVFSSINMKLLSQHGRQFTKEMEIALMGTRSEDSVRILLQKADLEYKLSPSQYLDAFQSELESELPNIRELPGATRLIDYFYSHEINMAICTSSNDEEFRSKTENYQHWLDKIPVHVCCCDSEVKKGKPAPDPYLVTMKRFNDPNLEAKNVLVFEDSITGVESALAAGATFVFIPKDVQILRDCCAERVDRVLKAESCELLNSLEEFQPTHYGLPSF